ncbi:hypothetical protein BASA62_002762 [Batrachochytrium salamandrivorans]|nr:hypothetical protein BASA62_002762 [Batrachochytrium salamandrivorans]
MSVLLAKLEKGALLPTDDEEEVQVRVLSLLQCFACSPENKSKMVAMNPQLIPALDAKLEGTVEVQVEVLHLLSGRTQNSELMMANHANSLLPKLVAKMKGKTPLQATTIIYRLSSSGKNQKSLGKNEEVVDALGEGREHFDKDIKLLSILTLVNLFGAVEDTKKLRTDNNIIAMAREDGWDLNNPLLAFRYLSLVKRNRTELWSNYGSRFFSTILDTLQQAIDDVEAAESAVGILVGFRRRPPGLDATE